MKNIILSLAVIAILALPSCGEITAQENNDNKIEVLSSKDFIKIDTIPVVTIRWSMQLSDSIIVTREIELRSWLQKELELDTLFIKRD